MIIIARREGVVRRARRCDGSVVGANSCDHLPSVRLCMSKGILVTHLILTNLLILVLLPLNRLPPLSFSDLSSHLPDSQSVVGLCVTG